MSLFEEAKKYEGTHEIKGPLSNQQIVEWIEDNPHDKLNDEVPWCSAFVNFICKQCGYERSHSNHARSWLDIGEHINEADAQKGDIVILKSDSSQPGPDDLEASGHVGFFSRYVDPNLVRILGGNQNDMVCKKNYDRDNILGIRRVSNE